MIFRNDYIHSKLLQLLTIIHTYIHTAIHAPIHIYINLFRVGFSCTLLYLSVMCSWLVLFTEVCVGKSVLETKGDVLVCKAHGDHYLALQGCAVCRVRVWGWGAGLRGDGVLLGQRVWAWCVLPGVWRACDVTWLVVTDSGMAFVIQFWNFFFYYCLWL